MINEMYKYDPLTPYRPTVYYYRRVFNREENTTRMRYHGLMLCDELEALKNWVREQGLIPPKFERHEDEWADILRDQGFEFPANEEPEQTLLQLAISRRIDDDDVGD